MARTLSNPTVEVNNIVIGIVPNSCSYKGGKGNKNVRPQSSGGDMVEMIVTEDAENKKSMVKFKLYPTLANIDYVKDWQELENGVAINLSDGDFTQQFRGMHITEDPEVALGADGELEITFEGKPST